MNGEVHQTKSPDFLTLMAPGSARYIQSHTNCYPYLYMLHVYMYILLWSLYPHCENERDREYTMHYTFTQIYKQLLTRIHLDIESQ